MAAADRDGGIAIELVDADGTGGSFSAKDGAPVLNQSFEVPMPDRGTSFRNRLTVPERGQEEGDMLTFAGRAVATTYCSHACQDGPNSFAATFLGESSRKGATFREAVMTMVINCIGTGIAFLPKMMADLGAIWAPLLCILAALVCLECGKLIAEACTAIEQG